MTVTAFLEDTLIAGGTREDVTRIIEDRYPGTQGAIRVFDDETGRVTDLDLYEALASSPKGRGRPKLGVTAREVTMLPRHWDWLARQKGGASAALRRLVEEAMKTAPAAAERRDAAYHFMQATCGDRLGYEEALRSLYKGEDEAFWTRIADWPADIRAYIEALLNG